MDIQDITLVMQWLQHTAPLYRFLLCVLFSFSSLISPLWIQRSSCSIFDLTTQFGTPACLPIHRLITKQESKCSFPVFTMSCSHDLGRVRVSYSVGKTVWNKGRYFHQKRWALQCQCNMKEMAWEYLFIYFSHFSLSCQVLPVKMCSQSGKGLEG